jgi:hypothetical protein
MGLIREQDEYRYENNKMELPMLKRGCGNKHRRIGKGPFGAGNITDHISTGLDLIDKSAKTATSVANAVQKGFETARDVDDYHEQKEKRNKKRQEKEDNFRKKSKPKESNKAKDNEDIADVFDKIVLENKRASGLHRTKKS